MIPTTQDADHFTATTLMQIGRVRAGILDLIDIGPTNVTPRPRGPSHREIAETERSTSPDGLMHPTPKSQSRRSGGVPSNPVLGQVLAWEAEVQAAVTDLFAIVTQADEIAHSLALPTSVQLPEYPATRTTLNGTVQADEAPAVLRRRILGACGYLHDVVDLLTGRLIGCDDPDIGDHLTGQARLLSRELGRVAGRVAPDRPRLCACGCRRPAPPKGQGATRGACRQRQSRTNRAS